MLLEFNTEQMEPANLPVWVDSNYCVYLLVTDTRSVSYQACLREVLWYLLNCVVNKNLVSMHVDCRQCDEFVNWRDTNVCLIIIIFRY